jgi:uroporphyrinogen-III synthase
MTVLLLKEPHCKKGDDDDPYSKALAETGQKAIFLAPLEHVFVDPDRLAKIISQGPEGVFSGVVFTSQRAVDAWSSAASSIGNNNESSSDSSSSHRPWSPVPFFAVGPATAAALASPTLPSLCAPSPDNILGGESSGTGAALADFITSTMKTTVSSSSSSSSLPLLFIKGDKGGESIRQLESESGLRVVSVETYATAPRLSFTADLSALLENNNNNGHGNIDNIATKSSEDQLRWIVFFSPSGAKAALPTLRKRNNRAFQTHAHYHARSDADVDELIRFAAIGPTTRDYLERIEHVIVHAVASAPEPAALVRVLSEAGF